MSAGFRFFALFAGLMVVSAVVVSCRNDSDGLSGTEWTLATLGGTEALADTSVSLSLMDDDELSGSGGCNRFTGTWQSGDDDALTLNAGAMTMMACPEPIMNQETAFMTALADTRSHSRDDDELTLLNEAEEELAVLRELERAELTDGEWEVTAFNNGQEAIVSVIEGTRITAVFDDDDQLNGNGGCNQYMTTYSTEDDAITIEPAGATRMACDQPIMDQETAYFAALEAAATFELGETTLTLRGADGALLVSFRLVES